MKAERKDESELLSSSHPEQSAARWSLPNVGIGRTTLALALLGFALRLFLIFPGPFESKVASLSNWADLRNYYWPAQVALQGQNPYELWASGQSGEFRADMAPLELALYVLTVALWNDPRAIQVLFAVFDSVNIALLGALFSRTPLFLPFQLFYAFGPLTVYNLVLVPEDKTLVLTVTFLIFLLLARQARLAAIPREEIERSGEGEGPPGRLALFIIVLAALLASFKWLSVFYLLPLLLFVSRDVRTFIRHGVVFVVIVALAHVPWFPSWSYVYAFRAGRVATPMHISPAVLLNALGVFDRTLLLGLLLLSLLIIYALYWLKRIDITETMALAVAAGILWTPDMDPVHLSIIVLYLLLVFDWSGWLRQIAVWSLSAWAAFVYLISTHSGFARLGIPDLRLISGDYGSVQMIVLSYPLFLTVLVLYLVDKWRGRAVGLATFQPLPKAGEGRGIRPVRPVETSGRASIGHSR